MQNLTVDIPLGVLCVVSGVSGAGKSSLVEESFVPAALASIKRSQSVARVDGLPAVSWIDSHGAALPAERPPLLSDVVHVDQRPLPGSLRSTPASCMKLFEPIRRLFAETAAAQTRNYGPSQFSFNARDGGRCPQCEGLGRLNIDMQFLPDLAVTCPECRGARFRRETLEIQYRGLNIDEVLRLTVREAWPFFSRQPRLLKRMQPLRRLGLDSLPLGRSISTLSGGERQRLKLAMKLSSRPASRTMFVLEEPTSGLHRSDVDLLTDCFDALREIGHSLLVVDNHPALIAAADWQIKLGPGAGSAGGKIIHAGPPAK